MRTATHQRRSAAHILLEALLEQGIEYIFGNLGTDHVPLIEELARWHQEDRASPQVVLCPHENTAVHMAGGYAAATGRGQAVAVHVDVGTANAASAMHNLFRARLPVLLMAGRAPFSSYNELLGGRDTYVHFIQEPFDQGSLVRPYVKWEYTLPAGEITKEVIARACSVMHSDSMGPAYLMLPREILASECDYARARPYSPGRHSAVKRSGVVREVVENVARRLVAANEPLLVTAYAGRQTSTPGLIDRLAQLAGVRVCEFNTVHLNISRDSPCFGGYQPSQFAETADFGLLVDVDVPWVPKTTRVNPDAFWVQIDVDAIKQNLPMWNFATDLRIEGDSAEWLTALIDAVQGLATPAFTARAARRVEKMATMRAEHIRVIAEMARHPGVPGALNPHYICAALGRAINIEDVVINEAIRNAPVVFEQIHRTRPGTLLGLSGGGLGYSGGMALGYKLAQRHRRVLHVVGDGSFYFGNPSSLYAVSRQYGLPIFSIVLDNGGWAAVKEATLRMYPDGDARRSNVFQSELAPDPNFARIAEAAGAYGEQLIEPDEVEPAIVRCLTALDRGRSAVLHVRVAHL
ncbi:MAG: thiamine pyrophosphate-requiring protein [Bryobacterales bacterium]|jgi:acetolactate synthase-1/2/3 large subunit|nr:thiamine pyrophosphate-requiring protein [Bryobacterales bacterium]